MLGTWQTINLNIVGCAVSAVCLFQDLGVAGSHGKAKEAGKMAMAGSTGGERRYDEPHIDIVRNL